MIIISIFLPRPIGQSVTSSTADAEVTSLIPALSHAFAD